MSVVLGALSATLVLAIALPAGRSTRRPLATVDAAQAGATDGRRPGWWRRTALALALLGALVVAPPLVVVVTAIVGFRRHRSVRAAARAQARAVLDELPDTVDLLLLCAAAGWSLPLAHPVVAARARPPVGLALADAEAATRAGRPRADALLAALVPLGDRAAALAHVLVDHLRYGAPLVPGLERLGLELRLDRRRRAEEDARRLPVRLLGPLVTCVLPAFALLTVVPLLAASLQSLPR